jgi:hypothetical protein
MLMLVLMFLKSAWFSGPEKGRFGVAEFSSRSVSVGSQLSAPSACVGMCRRPTVCSDAAYCVMRVRDAYTGRANWGHWAECEPIGGGAEVVDAGWLAPVLKFRQPSGELQCIKTACARYAVSVDQGVCLSV